ncbi:hypothetical protein GXB85_13460 [Cellulomonas sp. APG4]|uniref:hypothetical protein n=1 Tax=Cellulomonas sp. APG4 TaxID=1538656 RepID=UPI00137A1CD8|nr:hypothetical protein [Cellulomonas sp. APG4]NCT91949.1 hypothetical protein [Cellulomonas sp. APG4]
MTDRDALDAIRAAAATMGATVVHIIGPIPGAGVVAALDVDRLTLDGAAALRRALTVAWPGERVDVVAAPVTTLDVTGPTSSGPLGPLIAAGLVTPATNPQRAPRRAAPLTSVADVDLALQRDRADLTTFADLPRRQGKEPTADALDALRDDR